MTAGIRSHFRRAEGEREAEASRDVTESASHATNEAEGRMKWLGGRDSNPDNGVQSAVSYR